MLNSEKHKDSQNKDKDKDKDNKNHLLKSRLMSLPINLIGSVILFSFLGFLLDRHFEKKGLYLIIGVLLAIFWGFYEIFKTVFLINKLDSERDRKTK